MSKESEKTLKDYFQLCKIKNKWICQVIIDKENNRKCLAELANSGNTSGRNGHLKTHNKSPLKFLIEYISN